MGVTISPNLKRTKVFINGYTGQETSAPTKVSNEVSAGNNQGTGQVEENKKEQKIKE